MNKLIWLIFGALTFGLLIFFLSYPPSTSGGDVVEYFGITESLIKNANIHLTDVVIWNLKNSLNPGYFTDLNNTDQNGGLLYYLKGRNGDLYPVHFIFYSLLALPVRIILKILAINELHTLRITNLILFSTSAFIVLYYFLNTWFKRIGFLVLLYFSPLVWFIIWPGPDTFYTSFLLIAMYLFFTQKYMLAALITAISSWHSQPLIIVVFGILVYFFIKEIKTQDFNIKIKENQKSGELANFSKTEDSLVERIVKWINGEKKISFKPKTLLNSILIAAIIFIPYIYNLIVFGVLTPWTILPDGWTQLNGFGLQNASLNKLFEQLFDLNIGLFWYAPVLIIPGIYFLYKESKKSRKILWMLIVFVVTAFFYQTNPAWHYGTSGFGPTRHVLFIIPFFIYVIVKNLKFSFYHIVLIGLFIATQLSIMSFNGFLAPNFMNSLDHSPYAKFALDHFPSLYNPSPEIFIDRTNHNDLKYFKTAVYKENGVCKKAFILKTDLKSVETECGNLPLEEENKLEDTYSSKANYSRQTITIEATFWPDPGSCGSNFFKTKEKPYVCIKTLDEFISNTGFADLKRIKKIENYDGVWRIEKGLPVKITIPPGYFIHHYSFEGGYVSF